MNITQNGNILTISADESSLGTITIYHNPLHSGHCYLKLHLDFDRISAPASLFDCIRESVHQPLQVMADSTDRALISFLESGGFQCRRKCFERSFSLGDCNAPLTEAAPFGEACSPSRIYQQCTQLLYEQYAQKHAAVNPLTADLEAFSRSLPQTVFYQSQGNTLFHFAFVEENEIAYVGTTCRETYPAFLKAIVSHLLETYGEISFEADDCDWEAMQLLSLFRDADTSSFNTYIR